MAGHLSSIVKSLEIVLDPRYCEDVWAPQTAAEETEEQSEDDLPENGVGRRVHFARTTPTQRNVYKPGSDVVGTLRIVVIQPLRHTGVYLRGGGQVYVAFNSYDQDPSSNRAEMLSKDSSKDYNTKKDINLLQYTLLIEGGAQILPPGDHQIPFRFTVPSATPYSFDGGFGYVEHWVEATVDSLTVKKDIVIHGQYDLSSEIAAQVPFEQTDDEKYCCLCCADGRFGYNFRLHRRGCNPGTTIQPQITLKNGSPKQATATLKLVKKVKYKVPESSIEADKEVLCELSREVASRSEEDWQPQINLAKTLLPSHLNNYDHISIVYALKFKYEPGGCNTDLMTFETNLLIGYLPPTFMPQASLPQTSLAQPTPTYVYPSVDLSDAAREQVPLIPPSQTKPGAHPPGGLPYTQPQGAQPSAPPITEQPHGEYRPDMPAPPSYAELMGAGAIPSYPLPDRYVPPPPVQDKSDHDEKNRI